MLDQKNVNLDKDLFIIKDADKKTQGDGNAGSEGGWDTEFAYADAD